MIPAMPRVSFGANLQRHVACPSQDVAARTLGEALDLVFQGSPGLRSYILDDQGHIRRHVAVYVGDRRAGALAESLPANAEIYVFQALSGG
jgi:hypothetical protein